MSNDFYKHESCGNCYKYGEEVEVKCADGTVRGRAVHTCYGPQFVRFAGVPYAKPPVGPLRFLPPIPLGRWESTLDATTDKKGCWSYDCVENVITGSEDCLYTTIHTPTIRPKKPMPVIVWIGSWGFYFDDQNTYGPGWLTDDGTVVVYVSFRLGPFGFLSIREATAPGNCGLKDVVAALRWVQRNISAFGGDPKNVTLSGSMTGASIIHYMIISPLATGLFHKAIVQSGSALHDWALSYHPLRSARALVEELNVNTEDMIEAVEKLRTFPAEEIMKAFASLVKMNRQSNVFYVFDTIFKPTIEVEFEGQPAFLTQYPNFLLKSGKFNRVPMIIGSNRHEAKVLKCVKSFESLLDNPNLSLCDFVPRELGLDDCSRGIKNLGLRLLQFYVQDDKLTERNSEQFYNFLTDYYFTYFINRSVRTHAKYSDNPTFYYILEAASDWRVPEGYAVLNESACLGGEMLFLFQMFNCTQYGGGAESKIIRQKMLKLWTNFAKYGNPTPDVEDRLLYVTWDPVTDPEIIHYLNIGADLTKGCNPFYERMSFWDAVLDDTIFSRITAFFETSENRPIRRPR